MTETEKNYTEYKLNKLQEENEKLKKQIEKMKNCRNCKHFNQVEIHCDLYTNYECVNLDKWADNLGGVKRNTTSQ